MRRIKQMNADYFKINVDGLERDQSWSCYADWQSALQIIFIKIRQNPLNLRYPRCYSYINKKIRPNPPNPRYPCCYSSLQLWNR
jgi:hypothetical protein